MFTWGPQQVVAVDQFFSSVVLLMHMDGANGGTTFVDSSAFAKTVTANGGAQTSTTSPLFGSASGLFNGTSAFLSSPASQDFAFLAASFTVESWARVSSLAQISCVASTRLFSPDTGWALYILTTGAINFTAFNNNVLVCSVSGGSIVVNQWTHVAVTRAAGVIRIFLDGVQVASVTAAGTIPDTGNSLFIGRDRNTTPRWMNGQLDEFRITKGVARYTSNFAPPTAPFPDVGP